MNKQLFKQVLTGFAVALVMGFVFILVLSLFALVCHAKTTTRSNAFGAVIEQDNPYTYIAGTLMEEPSTVRCGKRTCTAVRVNAMFRPMLNSDQLLFCGDQTKAFANSNSARPMLLTYFTQASYRFDNMSCRTLKSVYFIKMEATYGN